MIETTGVVVPPLTDSDKKRWVTPQIRRLTPDDPLVKQFQSLCVERRRYGPGNVIL